MLSSKHLHPFMEAHLSSSLYQTKQSEHYLSRDHLIVSSSEMKFFLLHHRRLQKRLQSYAISHLIEEDSPVNRISNAILLERLVCDLSELFPIYYHLHSFNKSTHHLSIAYCYSFIFAAPSTYDLPHLLYLE